MAKCFFCKKDIDSTVHNYSIAQDMITKNGIIGGDFIFHNECRENAAKND